MYTDSDINKRQIQPLYSSKSNKVQALKSIPLKVAKLTEPNLNPINIIQRL